MNYIDIILGLLLLFAAINGLRKGLISELASLAALVLGVWGAIEFSYITTDFLTEYFNLDTDYLNIISFVVTFIVIVILVHLVGNAAGKLIEVAMLGFINRLAGLAFGVLRTALVLSIILLVFDKIDEDVEIISEKAKTESRAYYPIRNFAPSLFPFIDIWDDKTGKDSDDVITKVKEALTGADKK
ncbi:CvpA family protein [Mariniphaga sediminis]|uniref:CvpA family protein n=1 Tax=Mariniphaga sediminis TaxID=1628158 RepID=A0A399D1Z0_9BACT|nr:CvpA family protein [Mariniphaga sediminis]RIH65669.1 CvpA family protein [Mariniphaga sediminis]